MPEIPVDEAHRLLDLLDRVMPKIAGRRTKSIEVTDVPELSEVALEVLDWSNTAYVENKLRINPSILNKFVKMRGSVGKQRVQMLAERLRTYLKSQDQGTTASRVNAEVQSPSRLREAKRPALSAERWVHVIQDCGTGISG